MGLMNLFGLFGKKPAVTPTRQQERAKEREAEKAADATTPPMTTARAVNPARRIQRLSCRARKQGHEDASGKWMSKFDIHLLYKRGMALPKIREVFGHQAMRWAVTGR